MEKIELKVSMEPERLDALRYFLQKQQKGSPQKELERALEELYETYVPADTCTAQAKASSTECAGQERGSTCDCWSGAGRRTAVRKKPPLWPRPPPCAPLSREAGLGYPRRIGGPVGRISANFPGIGGVRF